VRKAGNKLRIAGQLIDATTDAHLWADTYDGILDDVFDIQEKVSRAMVDTLQLKLTAPEERQIAKRPIANVQAHDFYLRARDAMYRAFTAEGIDEAVRFLEAGLRITGDNALLLATLANVYFQAVRVWVKEEADLAKAEEYAHRALSLDPGMAPAHTVLGYIQGLQGNPREHYRLVKQALSLDPNDADTVMWAFWVFIIAGRTSRALDIARHMIELDPVHPYRFFYPAAVHAYEGRFELAVEDIRSHVSAAVLEQPVWLFWLGFWLVYAGRVGEAMEVLEPIEKVAAWGLYLEIPRLLRFALKGQRHRVDEVATGKFREAAKRDPVVACIVSGVYAMLYDREEALYWVEAAVDHGFINYPYLSQYDPLLAKLRDDPRFKKLMERVKYEWEHFEV
jgi:non-specific serine/threonine protein kinase